MDDQGITTAFPVHLYIHMHVYIYIRLVNYPLRY